MINNEEKKKIIDRVKKILSLSSNQGATEGEATAAIFKVKEILKKYNLSMVDVNSHTHTKTTTVHKVIDMGGKSEEWILLLVNALSKEFDCVTVTALYQKGYENYLIIGDEVDAKIVEYLLSYLMETINELRRKHIDKLAGPILPSFQVQNEFYDKSIYSGDGDSYRLGVVVSVLKKIIGMSGKEHDIANESDTEPHDTTNANTDQESPPPQQKQTQEEGLVLLKRTKLNAAEKYLQKFGRTKQRIIGSGVREISSNSYDAGRTDGDAIPLHKAVEGNPNSSCLGDP